MCWSTLQQFTYLIWYKDIGAASENKVHGYVITAADTPGTKPFRRTCCSGVLDSNRSQPDDALRHTLTIYVHIQT